MLFNVVLEMIRTSRENEETYVAMNHQILEFTGDILALGNNQECTDNERRAGTDKRKRNILLYLLEAIRRFSSFRENFI